MKRFFGIKPTKGRVFILPEENNPETERIALPEMARNREMPCRGTVFSIGGRRITKKGVIVDHEFKVGDRVLFRKFSGVWVHVRGHKLIQVGPQDVEAILE